MEAKLTVSMLVRSTVWLALIGLALFAGAGDPAWPEGWAFMAIFILGSIGFGLWLGRRDPALLASRLTIRQEGQAGWDKVFLPAFIVVWFAWMVLMGMDARRYHWSHLALGWNVLGGVLVIAGFLATSRVFAENSFAAPVIRVQQERGQRVIDTGPYAVVRHPMYASALLYLLGTPLLLGSLYGLLMLPVMIAGLVPRMIGEERLLARELPGYAGYMTRVRYRLIPGVW